MADVDGDSDGEPMRIFRAVPEAMDSAQIPALANSVRDRFYHGNWDRAKSQAQVIVEAPLIGSYYLLFPLKFGDNVCWLLKIPAYGVFGHWNEMNLRALTCEALIMQLLKRETTIPLPEVYDFNGSLNNEIKCPYILMQYIDSHHLPDVWFDHHAPADVLEARRTRTLEGIAAAMAQLDKYSFDAAGSIIFDQRGHPTGIGPMLLDQPLSFWEDGEAEIDFPALYETGPFSDPKAYFLHDLERRKKANPSDWSQGELTMLRLFIDLLPSEPGMDGKQFGLCHPDLDIQNVIVSEDGSLLALIDWDSVCAVPRSVGNRMYPSFLDRDWDPMMYGYDPEEPKESECNRREDSPETLEYYRNVYSTLLEGHLKTLHQSAALEVPIDLTRASVITNNLRIAVSNEISTDHIMDKIFEEIAKLMRLGFYRPRALPNGVQDSSEKPPAATNNHDNVPSQKILPLDSNDPLQQAGQFCQHESEDFYFDLVATALGGDTLDSQYFEYLKIGFLTLYHWISTGETLDQQG